MTFEPVNDLEKSLMRAANDPAHRPQFIHDLIASDIFVIQEGPAPERHQRLQLPAGKKIQLRNITLKGKQYLPIFTSLLRLEQFISQPGGYLAMNTLEFFKITQGAEIFLNPGSGYGKEFLKEEIASIIDGSIWQPTKQFVAQESTQVLLGQPARYPHELVNALSRFFKTRKQIKRAYLAHFHNPAQGDKPHTLIGIEVDSDMESIMSEAGMVASSVPIPDPPVDFVQITGRGGGLENYLTKETKPFYERKMFGLF